MDQTVPERLRALQLEIAALSKANEAYSARSRHSMADKCIRRQREIRIEEILNELSGIIGRFKRSSTQ